MSTSPTWIVANPAVGQEYIAPSAYWVIPNGGTSVTVTAQSFDVNGNLVTVSSMTAICRNVSGGSDAGSFTYNGGNTVNSTTANGVNGSNVFAPAGKVGASCAQLRLYISYTGRVYDQPPNAPSNLAPSGTVTTLTPTVTGSFSDPTGGDTLAQYEIVVNNASNGGGAQIWDSGNVGASASETANGAFSRAYGGSALAFGSSYSVKARVANQNGAWGAWSGWVNFATVSGPNAPAITAPSGQQTTRTPTFSFGYSSPAGTAMASYSYAVYAQGSGALLWASGVVSASVASGGSLSVGIPSAANLQYGGAYFVGANVTDANGATSGNSTLTFTIAALPQVAPTAPLNGVTVTTQTPTFVWSYTDPNYPQGQAQVEVQNAATSADLVLTGWLSQSATQWTSTTSIPYGTQIRWRVQVTDTSGLASGWSAWAYAYVNNAPSAAITAPVNASAVATVSPTVTWSYTPSSGGQAQASAQVVLADANGNPLATYTQSGAGTSFTLPAGILINGTTYQLQVRVTDTNSVTGSSAVSTFSVSLTPPADMAGQPLASGENWLTNALLNVAGSPGGAGAARGWATFADTGTTATFTVDPSVTQGLQQGSGDGAFTGAQRINMTAATTAGKVASVYQNVPMAPPGWVAGTTRLSLAAFAIVSLPGGSSARACLIIQCLDGTGTVLSSTQGALQGDTAGVAVRLLGPQNLLIPATTVTVAAKLALIPQAAGDTGTVWFYAAQLEAAAASDANVIEGSLGPGFTYDANGYSVRTQIAGGLPVALAAPGADTDPVNAFGGSVVLTWDTTLADPTRFTSYLLERRPQDQSTDDSAWTLLATLTDKSQASYTDYTAASQTSYQYALRQQITYSSGGVGISQHRAIVGGSVNFSPAWYLTNAGQAGAPIYNVRLRYVQPKRLFQWKERATYSAFLGRVGAARDAGAPAGYLHTLVCYFTELRGDSRLAIRRQFIAMQRLGGTWWLKDPAGLAVPVFLQDITFDDEATYSETLLTVTLALMQAADTDGY